MRRIPSIFGFSNHIHRNIPNDAFMDLEVIKHHLPELLDLRELLLHLDYEDSEPVSEGKCLLKEATETFIPIYVKPIMSYEPEVPQEIKDFYENISLETWGKYFCTENLESFNKNPCGFKPIASGEYVCIPIPLNRFFMEYSEYFVVENPNENFVKIEPTQATSSDGNTGTVQHFIHTALNSHENLPVIVDSGGYGVSSGIFNKFDITINIGVNSHVSESWNNGSYIPTKKETNYKFNIANVDPVGLDLTPVTFTKLVRNEE